MHSPFHFLLMFPDPRISFGRRAFAPSPKSSSVGILVRGVCHSVGLQISVARPPAARPWRCSEEKTVLLWRALLREGAGILLSFQAPLSTPP